MNRFLFLFTFFLISASTAESTKSVQTKVNSYQEYNSLVKDIPATQGLIDMNQKLDDLKVKVDSLRAQELK